MLDMWPDNYVGGVSTEQTWLQPHIERFGVGNYKGSHWHACERKKSPSIVGMRLLRDVDYSIGQAWRWYGCGKMGCVTTATKKKKPRKYSRAVWRVCFSQHRWCRGWPLGKRRHKCRIWWRWSWWRQGRNIWAYRESEQCSILKIIVQKHISAFNWDSGVGDLQKFHQWRYFWTRENISKCKGAEIPRPTKETSWAPTLVIWMR